MVFSQMKKGVYIAIKLFLIFITLMVLSACSFTNSEQTLQTSDLQLLSVSTTDGTDDMTDTTETSAAKTPLSDSFAGYEYLYENERDRAWEEDAVYLSRLLLGEYPAKGHPLISDREFCIMKPGYYVDLDSFYSEERGIRFIDEIRLLISRIPELSDTEILYEMQRIIAGLSDMHSFLTLPITERFTFTAEPFYTDDGVELYAVRLPTEYRDALYARLTAINGVPIEQVLERLSVYISRESDAGMMAYLIGTIYFNGLLYRKEALQVIGVVGTEEDSAQFEFVTKQGEHITAELSAVTTKEQAQIDMAFGDWFSSDNFSYEHMMYTYYWYRFDKASKTVYLRFNRISEMLDYPVKDFFRDLGNDISGQSANTIIIDLRFNPGGAIPNFDLVEAVLQLEIENSYVLIDGASNSGAVLLASELRQSVPNTLLIGQPAGQPPNFYADATRFSLPNSQCTIAISDAWYEYWPDYEYDVLMPDITVYQTLENYKQGIDTALEYVRKTDE